MAQISVARTGSEVRVNDFVRSVYGWMTIGLTLTGFVAYYVSNNVNILRYVASPVIQIALFLAVIGLVIAISGAIAKMSATTATLLFVVYSSVMGLFVVHATIRSSSGIRNFVFIGLSF